MPFPGFDRLVLSHVELQAVMRELRYASWRTALSSVFGIYLLTDTRDGKQYVGKADGEESIRQRWSLYATNGHGGNVDLRGLDPSSFRFSLLRVFDPATPTRDINAAESHFKDALATRQHGLYRNYGCRTNQSPEHKQSSNEHWCDRREDEGRLPLPA
ncbi:GIY-YIG nuclease family protein [Herbiconiux daphne]|uniref:GIY-YIG nuclease family protein n=1 Tax=Herbiconiux daphne TaxID=2970914 RepID=A0ABT2H5B9_9MICO|nr:GIY-YIG nuclease family protein [Herbiconiux daphne]MCS5735093.1 GIY-YIG nuclease family protein [Herbiconiux daphne]